MPKRAGHLYEKMLSIRVASEAFDGAMRDKKFKHRPGSIAFMLYHNRDYYIAEVGRILETESFKPKKPRESIRLDAGSGKERHIQAPALFPDQIVHWCVMLVLQDIFLKGMDTWCCASVKGRGTLYAKNFIERTLDNSQGITGRDAPERKYKYCLKMDIRKFFENIDRRILIDKLESKIKDPKMIKICSDIIYSVPGQGLPLGYYTSQWFANFYLQSFDHYLREVLMPKYGVDFYIRYMDDMLIMGSNKRKLAQLKGEISQYLHDNLKLELKNTTRIFSIAECPIDYIGFRFSYGKTVLRKNILHRARGANERLYNGKFHIKELRSSMAYNGWIQNTDTKQYRAQHMQGSVYLERKKISEFSKIERLETLASERYKRTIRIEEDIINLRQETELGDGVVLIRHYPDRHDQVRVVARSRYRFPDQDEYEEELRKAAEEKANKKKKKHKKKKHKPGETYRAPAERYFAEEGMEEIYARDYNQNIKDYDIYRDRQNTKDDWYKAK